MPVDPLQPDDGAEVAGLPAQDGLSTADAVLRAVRGIGHPAAAAIIRFLAGHDRAQIGQIIAGASLVRPTVNRHLRDLRELGVVDAEVVIGSVPKYTLNRARVEEITRAHLAYMLGEPLPDA